MAFQIIKHAIQMVIGNFGQALRVSIGPFLILVAAFVAVFFLLGDSIDALENMSDPTLPGESEIIMVVFATFGLFALALFVFAWVAVSWHRFILLEEYTGILPVMSNRPIGAYVGRSMLYGLLLMLLALPLLLVFGSVAASVAHSLSPMTFISTGISLAFTAIMTVPAAILTFVWFRIALALPSVAVGKPISLGQAWSVSSGLSGTIFGVAVSLTVMGVVGDVIIGPIFDSAPIIGFGLDMIVQWFLLMLGVSILTTLYGHLIEKRPLID